MEADRIIGNADGRRIVILGGSHSAYAVAWALLELPGAQSLVDGQIAVVQRRPPRVFYPDRPAAEDDGYTVAPGDICARTGRVNRMGGLRGHGRDIWRRIARRPDVVAEPRVAIHSLHDFSPDCARDRRRHWSCRASVTVPPQSIFGPQRTSLWQPMTIASR